MASRWENDDQRTTDICPHLTASKYSAITCLAAAVAPRRRGRIQHAHAGLGTAPAAAVLALPQLPEFCTASRAPPNGRQPPCTNKAATSWQDTCAVDGATTSASIDSLSCYNAGSFAPRGCHLDTLLQTLLPTIMRNRLCKQSLAPSKNTLLLQAQHQVRAHGNKRTHP